MVVKCSWTMVAVAAQLPEVGQPTSTKSQSRRVICGKNLGLRVSERVKIEGNESRNRRVHVITGYLYMRPITDYR